MNLVLLYDWPLCDNAMTLELAPSQLMIMRMAQVMVNSPLALALSLQPLRMPYCQAYTFRMVSTLLCQRGQFQCFYITCLNFSSILYISSQLFLSSLLSSLGPLYSGTWQVWWAKQLRQRCLIQSQERRPSKQPAAKKPTLSSQDASISMLRLSHPDSLILSLNSALAQQLCSPSVRCSLPSFMDIEALVTDCYRILGSAMISIGNWSYCYSVFLWPDDPFLFLQRSLIYSICQDYLIWASEGWALSNTYLRKEPKDIPSTQNSSRYFII